MSAVLEVREPNRKYLVRLETPMVRAFDQLATSPEGVAKLRELILSLAVQGKLLTQDIHDEPAGKLIQRIREEMANLSKLGEIRSERASQKIDENALPYTLPVGWQWVRLALVLPFRIGKTPPTKDTRCWSADGIRWVSIADMTHRGSISDTRRKVSEAASALFGHPPLPAGTLLMSFKLTIGKIAILEQPAFHNEAIASFRPLGGIATHFLQIVLPEAAKRGSSKNALMGATLNSESMANLLLPVPPLAEQHRIVSRVEELMKLCEALEQSGRLADEQHARLTSTLFDALASSESAHALAENWQRIAEHFDLLLDRPEAIDALEQTILLLAVRGLLVPQDANDEPAKVLLERLELKQATKRKVEPVSGEIDVGAAPYELPAHWAWAPLSTLVENMGSGWSPACDEGERTDPNRWAVLRTTAVQVMEYRSQAHKAIPVKLSGRPAIEVQNGDILITRAGPMNRVGISCWVDQTPSRLMLSDKIVRFHVAGDQMLPAFIVLSLNAGWTKNLLEAAKTGMAASQVNISQSDLRGMLVPVCSKAEQHRIITRVGELRLLCAQLRQRLTRASKTQSALADALVAQATAS